MQKDQTAVQRVLKTYGVAIAMLILAIALGRTAKFSPPTTVISGILVTAIFAAIFGAMASMPGRGAPPDSPIRFQPRRFAIGALTGALIYLVTVLLW